MKSEFDIIKDSDSTFDALLDEINKQKRLISQLQSDNRTLKTNEIRLGKTAESFKSENFALHQEVNSLTQKVRELEIQLTLPSDERTIIISRDVEPFPKKKAYQRFKWSYIVVPVVALVAIFIGKWWALNQVSSPVATASIGTAVASTGNAEAGKAATAPAAPLPPQANGAAALEEGYVTIENPLQADGMVRVMDSYNQKARVLAWINPSERYRIRAQSPQKMRRTYLKDGKSVTYEDYFYKISEKEQWVFGYFTNRRIQ